MKKSVIINTTVRWTGEIFNKLLLFVFFIILARYLGREEFGYFNYSIAFGSIAATFTDFGTNLYLLKKILKEKRIEDAISEVITLKIFISFVIFFIATLIAIITAKRIDILLLVTLFLLISAFLDPAICIFRSQKHMYYETILILIWRLLTIGVATCGIVFFNFNLFKVVIILNIFSLVSLVISFLMIKKIYLIQYPKLKNPDINSWISLLRRSLPIGIILVFGSIFFKFNIILLEHFKGAAVLGLYSAAFKLIESAFFISTFFTASVFPFMYETNAISNNLSKSPISILKKSALILFSIALIGAIFINLAPSFLLTLIYGNNFRTASTSLRILSVTLVFIFLNELFMYFYLSIEKEKLFLKTMGWMVLFYIILCFLMIPQFGASGSAAALFATQLLFSLFNYINLKKTINA